MKTLVSDQLVLARPRTVDRHEHTRFPVRFNRVMQAVCLSLGLMLLSACGDDNADANDPTARATGAEQTQSAPASGGVDIAAAETPEEVGKAVADLYISALETLNQTLADHPSADAAVPLLREIHDQHVDGLVTLGRRIENMTSDQEAIVAAAVSKAQSGLQYDEQLKPIYTAYQALNKHYIQTGAMSNSETFRSLFNGFNIITQYAFFDVLKKQEPEEAKRLGIE